jgi:hypothetical protein
MANNECFGVLLTDLLHSVTSSVEPAQPARPPRVAAKLPSLTRGEQMRRRHGSRRRSGASMPADCGCRSLMADRTSRALVARRTVPSSSRRWQPAEAADVIGPGTAHTTRPVSAAARAAQRSAGGGRLDDQCRGGHGAQKAFLDRPAGPAGPGAGRKRAEERRAVSDVVEAVGQRGGLVCREQPGGRYHHRLTVGRECTPRGVAVHAERRRGDDSPATRNQGVGEFGGDVLAVMGAPSRTGDRDGLPQLRGDISVTGNPQARQVVASRTRWLAGVSWNQHCDAATGRVRDQAPTPADQLGRILKLGPGKRPRTVGKDPAARRKAKRRSGRGETVRQCDAGEQRQAGPNRTDIINIIVNIKHGGSRIVGEPEASRDRW